MQHGYGAYIKRVAKGLREDLGLTQFTAMNPMDACEWLGIPVIPLTDLDECPDALAYFVGAAQGEFSAVTSFVGTKRFIVLNDSHHPHRQTSSLAHELGHALLLHEPAPLLSADGLRNWDGEIEEQAAFFSGVVLLPDEACRWIVKSGMDVATASRTYGVSTSMVTYRLGKSGARTIHARATARRVGGH